MKSITFPDSVWNYILQILDTRPHGEVVRIHAELLKQLSINKDAKLKDKIEKGNKEIPKAPIDNSEQSS